MLHIDILIRSKSKLNFLTYTNSDKYACVDVIVNVCALMLMINLGVGAGVYMGASFTCILNSDSREQIQIISILIFILYIICISKYTDSRARRAAPP